MANLKIVIADNESIIIMDVKEILEQAGHTVVDGDRRDRIVAGR